MTTRETDIEYAAKAVGVIFAFGLLWLLGGCASIPRERPDSKAPVCEALGDPLRYNSRNETSRRFAGPDLAPDLARRNRVGKNLRCPQYR